MSHFIEKCVCGTVLTQCRCASPNKTVRISIKPCTHQNLPPPEPEVSEVERLRLANGRLRAALVAAGVPPTLVDAIEQDAAMERVTCPQCNGRRTISIPITHPTNFNLDSWETAVCPRCTGRGVVQP